MKVSADRKQLITEGGWIAIGQGLAVIATLLGIRVLTELAPPQVYGTVTLLVGISALGVGTLYGPIMQAVLRYYVQYSQNEVAVFRHVIMQILFRRTIWGAVILVIAWPIAYYTWGTPGAMAVWVLPLMVCDGLRTLEITFLNAARNTHMYALLSAGEACAKPMGAISALLILGPHTEAILAGYTIATSWVLFSYYRWGTSEAILKWPVRVRGDSKIRSSVEEYARPLLSSSAIGWVNGVGDRYLIGLMIGVEQVGIYAAIYGLVSRPFLMAASIIELTIRPVYYSCVEKKDHAGSRSVLWKWFGVTASISLIGFITIFFAKDVLIRVLLAREYWGAVDLLPWIAGGYGLLVVSLVFEKVCFAHGRTGMVLFIQALGGILGLLITYVAIRHRGLLGAAMAVLTYFGLQLLIAYAAAHITEASVFRNVSSISHHRIQ